MRYSSSTSTHIKADLFQGTFSGMSMDPSYESQKLAQEIFVALEASGSLAPYGWTAQSLQQALSQSELFFRFDTSTRALTSFILYKDMGKVLEVLFLASHPQLRRAGEMGQLLSQFLTLGGKEVWLECRSDLCWLASFYESHGFKVTGKRASYYRDGTDAKLLSFHPQWS